VTIKRIFSSGKRQRVTAFVQPRKWDNVDGVRPTQAIQLGFTNFINGKKVTGPLTLSTDEGIRRQQNCKRLPYLRHCVLIMLTRVGRILFVDLQDGRCITRSRNDTA